ncbi:MAG: AAA family ATPase [Dehalococcoidia bacterium]
MTTEPGAAPPATRPSRVRALPAQPTPLIGREAELAALATMFHADGARLVTLTGPPGVGKARLALALAAGLSATYPDGVWFAPLDNVTDPDQVIAAIAQSLGVRDTGEGPSDMAVATAIASSRTGGARQLRAGARPQGCIATLLTACPALTVLVTSRARSPSSLGAGVSPCAACA